MLPLSNQHWLSPGARLSFQVLQSWVDTNSLPTNVVLLATKTLELQHAALVSQQCHIHSEHGVCHAHISVQLTACPHCPLAVKSGQPCTVSCVTPLLHVCWAPTMKLKGVPTFYNHVKIQGAKRPTPVILMTVIKLHTQAQHFTTFI